MLLAFPEELVRVKRTPQLRSPSSVYSQMKLKTKLKYNREQRNKMEKGSLTTIINFLRFYFKAP